MTSSSSVRPHSTPLFVELKLVELALHPRAVDFQFDLPNPRSRSADFKLVPSTIDR